MSTGSSSIRLMGGQDHEGISIDNRQRRLSHRSALSDGSNSMMKGKRESGAGGRQSGWNGATTSVERGSILAVGIIGVLEITLASVVVHPLGLISGFVCVGLVAMNAYRRQHFLWKCAALLVAVGCVLLSVVASIGLTSPRLELQQNISRTCSIRPSSCARLCTFSLDFSCERHRIPKSIVVPTIEGKQSVARSAVEEAMASRGIIIVDSESTSHSFRYMGKAISTTFGFIDDILVVGQAQTESSKEYYLISIAAASRMGQSDFGKNPQHIEGIVRALALKN